MELFTLQPLRKLQYVFSYNPAYSRITQKDHSKPIVHLASSLRSWQACLGLWSDGKIATKKQGHFLEGREAAICGSSNVICPGNSPVILKKTGVLLLSLLGEFYLA